MELSIFLPFSMHNVFDIFLCCTTSYYAIHFVGQKTSKLMVFPPAPSSPQMLEEGKVMKMKVKV
jgi:hypothetical protein